MNWRYSIRLFRVSLSLLTICISSLWLIQTIVFNFNKQEIDIMIYYENFVDDHIYPPPWYMSNWTINDYFIRKEHFKKIEDQYAISQEQKIVIKDDFQKRKKESNYLILEYTKVLSKPRFCGKTEDFIFGKQCPYKNCR